MSVRTWLLPSWKLCPLVVTASSREHSRSAGGSRHGAGRHRGIALTICSSGAIGLQTARCPRASRRLAFSLPVAAGDLRLATNFDATNAGCDGRRGTHARGNFPTGHAFNHRPSHSGRNHIAADRSHRTPALENHLPSSQEPPGYSSACPKSAFRNSDSSAFLQPESTIHRSVRKNDSCIHKVASSDPH